MINWLLFIFLFYSAVYIHDKSVWLDEKKVYKLLLTLNDIMHEYLIDFQENCIKIQVLHYKIEIIVR